MGGIISSRKKKKPEIQEEHLAVEKEDVVAMDIDSSKQIVAPIAPHTLSGVQEYPNGKSTRSEGSDNASIAKEFHDSPEENPKKKSSESMEPYDEVIRKFEVQTDVVAAGQTDLIRDKVNPSPDWLDANETNYHTKDPSIVQDSSSKYSTSYDRNEMPRSNEMLENHSPEPPETHPPMQTHTSRTDPETREPPADNPRAPPMEDERSPDQEVVNILKNLYHKILWDEVESDDDGGDREGMFVQRSNHKTSVQMWSSDKDDKGTVVRPRQAIAESSEFEDASNIPLETGDFKTLYSADTNDDYEFSWDNPSNWEAGGRMSASLPDDSSTRESPTPISESDSSFRLPRTAMEGSFTSKRAGSSLAGLTEAEVRLRRVETLNRFMNMDKEGQRKVTFEVFRKAYRGLDGVSDSEAQAEIERNGGNRSGAIDSEEWAAWLKFKTRRMMRSTEMDVELEEFCEN